MARVFERVFRLAGYEVTIATNGEDALQQLSKIDPPPPVVLLDIVMPKMSGRDVLRNIKTNPRYVKTVVAILTNSIRTENKQEFIDMGADLYMVKIDHTPSEVLKKIEDLVQAHDV